VLPSSVCCPARWSLAWMLARTSPRTIPLIGTTRVRRYEESLAALSIDLSLEQPAALNAA